MITRFLLLVMLCGSLAAAPLPEVTLGKVLNEGAGGSFTAAMAAQLDGKKVFVKSVRGNARGTRYANLEADVLAASIFQRIGVRCPKARIVRLSEKSTCRDRLGSVVQIMEFVDTRFAGGKVFHGFWPTVDLADVDTFIKVALVDCIIGNADRRDANFFISVPYQGGEKALHTPVPIDNNAGFGTMIPWFTACDQVNFVKSYDGLGNGEIIREMGTIANLVRSSPLLNPALGHPALEKRIFEIEAEMRAKLDDGWWSAAVSLLPNEMIPNNVKVDPEREMPDNTPLPKGVTRATFFGTLSGKMSHADLVKARRAELRETFAWRRDHLREALQRYIAWRRKDPEQKKLDRDLK